MPVLIVVLLLAQAEAKTDSKASTKSPKPKSEVALPKCINVGGQRICGYNCLETASGGDCAEKGGSVTCFDPDKYVICAKGKSTPKPDCVYASGTYTCGYDCKINYGIVGCAKTPNGTCNTDGYGKPVCFDPPVRGGDEQCVELIGFK